MPAVMGGDYGKGNLRWNYSNCSCCSSGILGKRFGIIRVILCKCLGGCSRIQVVLGQGTSWVWPNHGPVPLWKQERAGTCQAGRGVLPALRCLISPPASAAAFFCPNSKALSLAVPLPWALSMAGSCCRAPLEQLNTTGMAL